MVDRVQTLSYRLTRTGTGHADGHAPPGPAAACPITRHPAVFRRVPQPAHRCIRITAVAGPADRQCRLRTASRRQHGHPPTSRPQRHNRSSPRHSLEIVAARSAAVMHGRNGLVPAERCVRRSGYSVPLTAGPVSPVVVAHRRRSATTLAAARAAPWRAPRPPPTLGLMVDDTGEHLHGG